MDLSPQGHSQAEALAKYLRQTKFDAIYSSPMKRAQQTLAPLITHSKIQPTTISNLCEVHFGDWTGLSWQEVHDKYQVSAFQWLEMLEQAAVPNGECSRTFRARIEPCLREILQNHPGQNVAVVCHGGVINAYMGHIISSKFDMFFRPAHTSINICAAGQGVRALNRLNDVHHLRTGEGSFWST